MKNNWQTRKLGEVCDIYQPKTISAKEMTLDGKYVVFGANGVIGRYDKYNHEAPQLLITCRGATCGSVNISTPKSWITGNAMVVRPKDHSLEIKYLEYIFRGGLDLSKVITGAAQPQITRANLEPVKISYPESISEQRRIVKILDEVFEKTADVKENAEKNLQNARELFESYLQSVFANPGDGWEEKKIEEVCTVIAGQSPEGKYYNFSAKGLPFYQGKKEFTEKYIGEPTTWTTEITKEAVAGDILMSVRAPVGPVNFSTQKICIGRGLAAIRATKKIDIEFLFNFLVKHESEIVGNAGAVFASINKSQIESIQIPLPSLPEQRSIVAKLDALSLETKKLEAIYQQKLADLDELKKSVLRKAFEGEL